MLSGSAGSSGWRSRPARRWSSRTWAPPRSATARASACWCRWPGGGGGGVAGTGGRRPGGAGPPAGAGAQVAAIPADVGAAAAAVGDQLDGGQGDAAQPAAFYLVVLLVGQIWLPGACHTVHL